MIKSTIAMILSLVLLAGTAFANADARKMASVPNAVNSSAESKFTPAGMAVYSAIFAAFAGLIIEARKGNYPGQPTAFDPYW